ncbi:TetR/AcrR family transcriptional regulator [Kitasatospora sp. HPMI-4]|uniref:TetR/AcrR family transcriptional regulator n=1 Tax=Kitasatospora sp. HPMI-4 TaxID=3448443 RepID=UPI003F19EC80
MSTPPAPPVPPALAAPASPRAALIADTAIALIAERGLRGLTHRAVDEAAGLPTGSTSNHARTRAALLAAALTRIAEREHADFRPLQEENPPLELLLEVTATGVHQALTDGLPLTLARLELALEATRRPELRTVYDRLGAGFRALAARLLARAGSAEPERDARGFVRWCEGVIFDSAAGAGHGHIPTPAELRAEAARYLAVLLGEPRS